MDYSWFPIVVATYAPGMIGDIEEMMADGEAENDDGFCVIALCKYPDVVVNYPHCCAECQILPAPGCCSRNTICYLAIILNERFPQFEFNMVCPPCGQVQDCESKH